jgi:catenin delta-2
MNYNHHIESQSQLSSTGGPPQGSMYDSGVVGGNNGIYQEYEHYPVQYANSGYGMAGNGPPQSYLNEYGINERSGTPPSERSVSPSQLQLGLPSGMQQHQQHLSSVAYLQAPYDEMADYNAGDEQAAFYGLYGTAGVLHPSGVGVGGSNNQQTRLYAEHEPINGPVAAIRSRYATDDDDELQKHMQSQLVLHSHAGVGGGVAGSNGSDHDDQQRQMRWRDPNLTEVISFLNNPNSVIVANAAAFLQHLCYMDDPNKQRTRTLGGIPPLVKLLSHEAPDVYRNACGALRNLSYGRQNDENKRAIKNAGGIPSLIQLLRRSSEADVKEIVTSVIWNLSSCEDLKRSIIDDGIIVIVSYIVIPHSGWDSVNSGETCWSTVFRNASGVLRNVSSAGEYARTKLRDCAGLVDSLLYVVKSAIEKSNIGNKIVENCVCILRNLSYRCQEVEDPNYDKHPLPSHPSRSQATVRSENLGCFGGSKKKKDAQNQLDNSKDGGAAGGGFDNSSNNNLNGNAGSVSGSAATIRVGTMGNNGSNEPIKGAELLWQPEVVQSYLALLQSCSNPETLEAAAGALQNLAACYWQPSIEIRAAVRKEKGLPILVELLRMEVDRVVCAVATALRNLAIDQRNKELIGKYAMRDLVQKLPSGNPQHDQSTSDDTIAAVLATLNEVIKKNAEFSRSLLDAGGVERLMNITRQKQKYTARVLKFGIQVLFTMWQHQELRDVYKKHGWKESDFVTKTVAARNGPSSPNNTNTNTLNRPFESQGRTRYEDRTIKRSGNNGAASATGNASQNNLSIATNQNSLLQQAGNRGGSGGNLMLPPIYQRVIKRMLKDDFHLLIYFCFFIDRAMKYQLICQTINRIQ